jgi:hypothetical protein
MVLVASAFIGLDASQIANLETRASVNGEAYKTQIIDSKTNSLLTSVNTAEATNNQAMNYGLLLSRNKSLADVANNMAAANSSIDTGAKDTYTRQAEINEWQANNKNDTLFFLQLLFLFFTVVVILLFLRQYGILPSGSLWVIVAVLVIILLGTLWNRASYTFNSRDKRYWNRRFIGLADSGLTAKATCQNA